MRITVLDLERQVMMKFLYVKSIMTKDNVTIQIDASVYYIVRKPQFSQYRIENVTEAVSQVTYAVLKNAVGSFTLQELLEKRQEVSDMIEDQVEKYVEAWQVWVK